MTVSSPEAHHDVSRMTDATARVYWRVRAHIDTDMLRAGDRIGTERDLSLRLGCGRNLLRQALAVLEGERRVIRTIGRSGGIFVSDGKVVRPLNSIVSLPTMLRRQGFIASTRLLDIGLAVSDAEVSRALGIEHGAPVVRIRRVRAADGDALSFETTHLPSSRFPRLIERDLSASLYDVMSADYGVDLGRAVEQIQARTSTISECEALGLDAPEVVFEIRRVTLDAGGTPVEHAIDVFRAELTRIHVNAVGGSAAGARVADPRRKIGALRSADSGLGSAPQVGSTSHVGRSR